MRSEERQQERDQLDDLLRQERTLLSLFPEVWRNGCEYVARCPLHADKTPSLTVYWASRRGRWLWRCFPCEKGGDALDLLRAMGRSYGRAVRDLGVEREIAWGKGPRPDKQKFGPQGFPRGRIVRTYDYASEDGTLLYQVVRLDPKSFRQRRPDGKGDWDWRLGDVRRVLYRLPQLLASSGPIYVVEGEKDADRLCGCGLTATTNCGGAGNWRPEYAQAFEGRRVVVLPDNDEAGRKHALDVFRSLQQVARTVIFHRLDVAAKGDVSDWLDSGHNVAELPG